MMFFAHYRRSMSNPRHIFYVPSVKMTPELSILR